MTEHWFKPKTYGYGATPSNWKGWASSLIATVILLAVLRFIVPIPGSAHHPVWEVLLGLAVAFAVVIGFSRFARTKTDGEWRWRWGKTSN